MKFSPRVRTKWISGLAILITGAFLLGGCTCATPNNPPVISNLVAEEDVILTSQDCKITCIASDLDGDNLTYEWAANGGNISGEGSMVTWTAPDEEGTYTITVMVIDDRDGESEDSLTINVMLNHPPIIEDLVLTPEEARDFELEKFRVYRHARCKIECVASDPDKDELSYEWSAEGRSTNGGKIAGKGRVITWAVPNEADTGVTITVTVSDGRGGTDTESIVFRVVTCRCSL